MTPHPTPSTDSAVVDSSPLSAAASPSSPSRAAPTTPTTRRRRLRRRTGRLRGAPSPSRSPTASATPPSRRRPQRSSRSGRRTATRSSRSASRPSRSARSSTTGTTRSSRGTRTASGGKPEEVRFYDLEFEKIAALQPDLITMVSGGISKKDYETLTKIAPVVGPPVGYQDSAVPYGPHTLLIGQAVGLEAEAQAAVDALDAQFAAVRERPPRVGRASAPSTPRPTPGAYYVLGEQAPRTTFLTSVGFTLSPELSELVGDDYSKEISAEELDLVGDLDLVVWCTDEGAIPDVQANPVVSSLDSVKDGNAIWLTYASSDTFMWAMDWATVLSGPYAIEKGLPAHRGGPGGREPCRGRSGVSRSHDRGRGAADDAQAGCGRDRHRRRLPARAGGERGRGRRTPLAGPAGHRASHRVARAARSRSLSAWGSVPGRCRRATVWDSLLHDTGSEADLIVRELRVPRTIAGVLVGMALGLAGALMQALTRNPLADPGILGVNAGAACAVVLAIAFLGITQLDRVRLVRPAGGRRRHRRRLPPGVHRQRRCVPGPAGARRGRRDGRAHRRHLRGRADQQHRVQRLPLLDRRLAPARELDRRGAGACRSCWSASSWRSFLGPAAQRHRAR